MNDAKLALFAENAQIIKKGFTWQDTMTKRLASLLYALEDKRVNSEAIRECHTLIKANTGVFSVFRGDMSLCVAAMLSLKHNREELLADTLSVYSLLKNMRFHTSDYLAIAAYQIAANAPKERHELVVSRTRAFYEGMKSRRWFLTGQDDYIFAAMLGLSDIDPNEGAERIEKLFQNLKPEFWTKNSVQALAQILVLSGQSDEAVSRVLSLRSVLRSNNVKLDKMYTLPSLGVLCLLPVDGDVIARDILDAQAFLKTQKGFGAFSVSSQELLLYAAAIVSAYYSEDQSIMTASISTSIASIIIAQQAAMIAAIASSNAAAASAATT